MPIKKTILYIYAKITLQYLHICYIEIANQVKDVEAMSKRTNKLPAYFGGLVSELRKRAGMKQSEVAQKLTVDASRISRIESGEIVLNSNEAQFLLAAIDTEDAKALNEFLSQEWRILERPHFYHPQRISLYEAELTLQKLAEFCEQDGLPTPLYAEAKMHEDSLLEVSNYLMSLRHSIAYIGDLGVGKTTAVCIQTGLNIYKSDTQGLPSSVLETGAGGTTVCEVRIHKGPQYSLQVDPVPDSEIYKLAGELCAGIYESDTTSDLSLADKESQVKGVSREIDRALRNMTGLTRRRQKSTDDGKTRTIDPLKELAKNSNTLDELCSEFNQKLSLWKRSRREIAYSNLEKISELEWLQKIFIEINNGRNEDFSLPQRIDITIPFDSLHTPDYEIEIIDTKGIDQTAIRPDLQSCIDDPRAIIVLCSRFNDAPGTSSQVLIEHLNNMDQSSTLKERVSILVLPRADEAMAMKDDCGEPAQDDQDGYDMKSEQIKLLLNRVGYENVPLHFFNATSDHPQLLDKFIVERLNNLRQGNVDRISKICNAIDYLIKNQEEEFVRVSKNEVSKRLKIFLKQYPDLPEWQWRVEESLLEKIRTISPRTVWASLRREGSWDNLDVHFTLGYATRVEAFKCTSKRINGLREIIANMLGDNDLQPSYVFLQELDSNLISWYSSFLSKTQEVGSQLFRRSLDDNLIWIDCANIYGQQRQFRLEVAQLFKEWFTNPEQQHLYDLLEEQIRGLWTVELLDQLRKFVDSD